jgi:phosphopantetheine--protein transferase-like protein|tara:strand:- start:54 stop:425 length:372 start_codon:yes stop_codon:yes gene_type:complete
MFARENLIGIDLQTIEPIQKIYDKWGDRFVNKILTDIEKKNAPSTITAKYLTKCWCVKEAYSKAIASPYLRLDVSYMHLTSRGVRFPVVHAPVCKNMGPRIDVRLSLSDTDNFVVAMVYIWAH